MKLTTITILALLALTFNTHAFLAPSNAPPVVQLAWTPSPDPSVTNYNLYFGVGSGQYTNIVSVGNVTNASVTLPSRGVTYYFAVTALGGGLESVFSNEVNYAPKAPPGAPGMKPPVTLVVQSKTSGGDQWADAGMDWSLSQDDSSKLFRLRLITGTTTLSPQQRAIRALHMITLLPPTPGQ